MKIAKKIISMCLALALIVTTFAVNTVDVKAAEEVTLVLESSGDGSTLNLTFTRSDDGDGENEYLSYDIKYYYDGTDANYSSGIYYTETGETYMKTQTVNVSSVFGGKVSGSANVLAKAFKDGVEVASSNEVTITIATTKLNKVQNLRVEGTTVKWDAVDGASAYNVQLMKKTGENSYTIIEGCNFNDITGTSLDFSAYSSEVEQIVVRALSGNTTQNLDSDFARIFVTNNGSSTTPNPPTNDSNESNKKEDVVNVKTLSDEEIHLQKAREREARQKKVVIGADGKEVKTELPGVYEVSNLAGTAVKTAKADVAKAVGLTDEEIQNGTNTSIYMSDGLSKEVKDLLKEVATSNGKKVLSMFMADMYKISKAGVVVKTNTLKENVEMVLGISGSGVDANKKYSVLCVTPDGQFVEFKDMDNDSKTITVNANVFGNWVVVY